MEKHFIKIKNLPNLILIILLLTAFLGCAQKNIDSENYERFGVLADIHGDIDNLQSILKQFDEKGIDKIIIAGDICDAGNDIDDKTEIIQALGNASATGIIYVIPGNHDALEIYESVISELNSENVIDMYKERRIMINEIQLISNPFGSDFTYHGELKKEDEELKEAADYLDDAAKFHILITHQPPKTNGKCIDFTGSKNVGSAALDEISKDIELVISGHIHESATACVKNTLNKWIEIEENTWHKKMRYNPGSVIPWKLNNGIHSKGMAGIIEIDTSKEPYNMKYNKVSI